MNKRTRYVFLYCVFCIVLPVSFFDMAYIQGLLLFPIAPTILLLMNTKTDSLVKHSVSMGLVWCSLLPFTVLYEWLGVDVLKIWWFASEMSGYELFSYPFEEFIFWWGMSPMLMLLNIYLEEDDEKKILVLDGATRSNTRNSNDFLHEGSFYISKKALGQTVFFFAFTMFFFERSAITHGWWVYDQRFAIAFVWGIPVSEGIFYVVGPLLPNLLRVWFHRLIS